MLHDRPPPLTRKRAPTMNPARHMSREIRTSGAVYSEVTYSEQCGVCHYWAEIQGPLTHQHKKTNRSLHKTDAGRRIPVSYLERPVPLAVSYADGRSHYGGGGGGGFFKRWGGGGGGGGGGVGQHTRKIALTLSLGTGEEEGCKCRQGAVCLWK